MDTITVVKLDHTGRKVFSYTGRVLDRGEDWVQVEAHYHFEPVTVADVEFRHGDRFIEWYDRRRQYTIYQVHDAGDDHIKGWYCDIVRPLVEWSQSVAFHDLALDLWVWPDGRMLVLDEDEFADLPLSETERASALAALDSLRRAVNDRTPPFDRITTTEPSA